MAGSNGHRYPRPAVAVGEKWCIRCLCAKPITSFGPAKHTLDRLYPYCRDCNRAKYHANPAPNRERAREWYQEHRDGRVKEYKLQKTHGLSLGEFRKMLATQGGGCAICGGTQRTNLAVDHDHETGRVRGLLCGNCNNGLGRFRDSPTLLAAAILYLQGRRAAEVA